MSVPPFAFFAASREAFRPRVETRSKAYRRIAIAASFGAEGSRLGRFGTPPSSILSGEFMFSASERIYRHTRTSRKVRDPDSPDRCPDLIQLCHGHALDPFIERIGCLAGINHP